MREHRLKGADAGTLVRGGRVVDGLLVFLSPACVNFGAHRALISSYYSELQSLVVHDNPGIIRIIPETDLYSLRTAVCTAVRTRRTAMHYASTGKYRQSSSTSHRDSVGDSRVPDILKYSVPRVRGAEMAESSRVLRKGTRS